MFEVYCKNTSEKLWFGLGTRFAQIIFHKTANVSFSFDSFNFDSKRNNKGFGSFGVWCLVMDDVFAKYNTARSLFRELMNIFLLCTYDSNYYYCYCHKEKQPKCTLCEFCEHFCNVKIENKPIKNFLIQNNKEKDQLNKIVNIIKPFFDKVKFENKGSLDFFNKEYYWHSRDISTGTISYVTLDQIIKEEISKNGK